MRNVRARVLAAIPQGDSTVSNKHIANVANTRVDSVTRALRELEKRGSISRYWDAEGVRHIVR